LSRTAALFDYVIDVGGRGPQARTLEGLTQWAPRRREPQPKPGRPLPPSVRDALAGFGQADWPPSIEPHPNTLHAKEIWAEAVGLPGTPAETYLHRRRLASENVDPIVVGLYPWAKLRFAPRCRLPEDMREELKRTASPL
jgi:hypothetical protein